VKVVIEFPLEHHGRILKYANEASPVYSTLINGVKIAHSDGQSEIIVILCDEEQAEMLQQVAKHFCPEAVPKIIRSIRVARSELPRQRGNFTARASSNTLTWGEEMHNLTMIRSSMQLLKDLTDVLREIISSSNEESFR
jgi:hypothetical protein